MLQKIHAQDLFQPAARNERLLLVAQLLQQAPTMYDLDMLFEWLARAIVRRYTAQVAQFWAAPDDSAVLSSLMLHALACRSEQAAKRMLTNEAVAAIVERMVEARRGIPLCSAEGVFSAHQAIILKRCGLHYCCGFFWQHAMPRYTPRSAMPSGPAALALAALLFFEQVPAQKALQDIHCIVGQALRIAQKHGLQLPPAWTAMPPER